MLGVFPALIALSALIDHATVTTTRTNSPVLPVCLLANVVVSPVWLVFVQLAQLSMAPHRYRMAENASSEFLLAFAFFVFVKLLIYRLVSRGQIDLRSTFASSTLVLLFLFVLFCVLTAVDESSPHLWRRLMGYVPTLNLMSWSILLSFPIWFALRSILYRKARSNGRTQ